MLTVWEAHASAPIGNMDGKTLDNIKQEKTDMHCYKTFAAATLVANIFETLPEIGRKLPYALIAEWMAQNDIEPEDVLYIAPDAAKAKLVGLIEHNRPQLSRAA